MANDSLVHGFYVYLHKKPASGEVFYVGKGSGKRAWQEKGEGRNAHWQNTVNKHGLTVEIYASGLQEWYALELEKEMIAYYGRADLKQGTLVNWTDGGDGVSGYIAPDWLKALWGKKSREAQARPEVKKRHQEGMIRSKEKTVAAIRKSWSDPARKARFIEACKKRSPETYKKLAEHLLAARKDPEVEKRRIESVKKAWAERGVGTKMVQNRIKNRIARLESAGQLKLEI